MFFKTLSVILLAFGFYNAINFNFSKTDFFKGYSKRIFTGAFLLQGVQNLLGAITYINTSGYNYHLEGVFTSGFMFLIDLIFSLMVIILTIKWSDFERFIIFT